MQSEWPKRDGRSVGPRTPRGDEKNGPRSGWGLNYLKRRLAVLLLIFVGGFLLVAFRLVYLQAIAAPNYQKMALLQQRKVVAVTASRGRILDRDGAELALDVPGRRVVVNALATGEPREFSRRLCRILNVDVETETRVTALISRARQRAMANKKAEPGRKVVAYLDLPIVKARREIAAAEAVVKRDKSLSPVVSFRSEAVRERPSGEEADLVIGRVRPGGAGNDGIEQEFDAVLTGKNGSLKGRKTGRGQIIPGTEQEVEAVQGRDVRLAIHRDIQHYIEDAMSVVARDERPDKATGIVMEVGSGEILGMSSWPNTARPGDDRSRRHIAVTDVYEPGSTVKVMTAAAALEAGVNTHYYCNGSWTIPPYTMRCAHNTVHGQVDLRRMISQSCNLAAGHFAQRVGARRLYGYLRKFGIRSRTGIEFPGEGRGLLAPPSNWRAINTANIGFGQGVSVTPIQLLAAYAAIANDGIWTPPRLVLDAPGAEPDLRAPRRVMKSETAQRLLDCMETTVEQGTGKRAKIPGYSVAGKTGTAQFVERGRYGGGYVTSFVGFVPAKRPRLAILVSVWRPRKNDTGGAVAGPVFREIARNAVRLLGIPADAPDDRRDGALPETMKSPSVRGAGRD